jgi:hypothetical protein
MTKTQVDKSTGGHYPAPYAILELLKTSVGKSRQEWLRAEAAAFAKLAGTKESEALFGVFFSTSEVKKHDFGAPKTPIKTVAVCGTSDKCAGIAQISLDGGEYPVLVKGDNAEAAADAKKAIIDAFKKKLKLKRMRQADYDNITSRLTVFTSSSTSATTSTTNLTAADIVFECAPDDLALKQKTIYDIESQTTSSCILATTTSEFSVGNIAENSKRPEKVIGLHYNDPLAPFVEIVIHKATAPEVRTYVHTNTYVRTFTD